MARFGPSALALIAVIAVTAVAGCRQLFGIEDTDVVGVVDAPGGDDTGDAAIDGGRGDIDAPPGTPDAAPDAPPAGCPPSYNLIVDNHRYRLSGNLENWTAAAAACVADSAAAYLVVPDGDVESNFLANLNAGDVWIGVTDQAVEGTWVSVLGAVIPPAYSNWQAGEPQNGLDPSCAAARTSAGGNDGRWEARKCDGESDRYLCECEPQAPNFQP